jgi:SAM-dependent methyltransferase
MTVDTYRELFEAHEGRAVRKWDHYFEIYDRYLSEFRGKPVTMLEIGVADGGSLELWRKFLGPEARLIGLDIDPRCLARAGDGIEIFIGDQGDPEYLKSLAEKVGPFDIILDDGSHRMEDLRTSFLTLFKSLTPGGVYLAEDLHTCYWPKYGGGRQRKGTFIENLKSVIDDIHALHSEDVQDFRIGWFTLTVKAMHFHDSVAVIEKTEHWDDEGKVMVPKEAFAGGTK